MDPLLETDGFEEAFLQRVKHLGTIPRAMEGVLVTECDFRKTCKNKR